MQLRVLGIPTVLDRFLQQALHIAMGFDPDGVPTTPCSRPKPAWKQAMGGWWTWTWINSSTE
jgi:hypothetical protein